MRTSSLVTTALLVLALAVHAQDRRPSGARIASLSGASTALASETWSAAANPASLVACSSLAAAAYAVPAPFGLSELRTVGLAAVIPVSGAVLGGSLYRFGFDLYKETGLSLALGGAAAAGLAVGGSVHARLVEIARYGERLEWSADLGAVAEVLPEIWIGALLRSLWGAVILLPGQELSTSVSVAIAGSPRENTLVIAELERQEGFDPQAKLALECAIVQSFTLRCGWSISPESFSAGCSLRMGVVEFAYAGSLHTELGWTHGIELQLPGDLVR